MRNIFISIFLSFGLCSFSQDKSYIGKQEHCIIVELLVNDSMDVVNFKTDTLKNDTIKYTMTKSNPEIKNFPILYFVEKVCVKQEELFVDTVLTKKD